MNRLLLFLAICLVWLPGILSAQYEEITLEKLYRDAYFRHATVNRGMSMQDGLRYALISNRTDICIYEYESGNLLETIFSTHDLMEDEHGRAPVVNSYAFSRDERMLLIGVNETSIYRRSRIADYYLYDIADNSISPVSQNNRLRLPEFSPDGKKIAFVRDNNLYVVEIESGKEYALTEDGQKNFIINGTADWVYEEEFGFTKGFFWSHDSRYIAFYRFDESRVKEFNMLTYGTLYPEENRFKYPRAGEENASVDIYIADILTGTTVKADFGDSDYYVPRVQWTNNTGKLSVQLLNRHQNRLEILLMDAVSGNLETLYVENNLYYIGITNDLHFLKNGHQFVISSEKSGYNHLYLYDMAGREIRALTSGNFDVERFLGVDERNSLVYYLAREVSPLTNALYSVQLNGREKRRLTSGEGINNPTFSQSHAFFINEFSTIDSPPVFSLHHSDGSLVKWLERNESLAGRIAAHGFMPYEFFTLTTSEGVSLNAYMLKPPMFDPGKKYPVLMYVYGGPGSQTVVNRWSASHGLWFQMLAQMGYIIVSVDNRGTGYRGEQFKKMTYQELGKYEAIDQIEAARYLAGTGYVDAGRIGIFGWSYGGYMSALALALGEDAFAAAIAVAPVTSWRYYDSVYTERYLRTPQENPYGYDNNSPISHVDKIRGRLLLVHGSADDNVHYQNTIEMATALIREGVQFDLMIYPDQNHGIGNRQSRMHLYTMMTNFLEQHLKQ